ncbi:hypothetical protein PRIPAC_96729 [Pristionchus pacificus]|uniref:Uncharacterized protein n=1 Tax=Pristionchus pacificus TaxID=54126 RepID=A0A2A6D1L0_PRIPA|nr:hypothetical protein PRIPAC_96729 [Pristionchus pacificus]|eukprot:PDM84268.1 hypothetical protein PRIPAC_33291 [Pristionchus pacificus]
MQLPEVRFRVIHNHDIIPHCPFQSDIVWYENGMGPDAPYTVCVGQEDPNCSATNKFDLNFDHTHYYGMPMEDTYGRHMRPFANTIPEHIPWSNTSVQNFPDFCWPYDFYDNSSFSHSTPDAK